MTDHFQDIYANKAAEYDAMVSREDYQGNILTTLNEIQPLADLTVVEFGAGTGRLTRLLAPKVRGIRAFDNAPAMLIQAQAPLIATGAGNWSLELADNVRLPVADQSADLTIAGWSFGHATGWYPETWQAEITKALSEMQRITRPGGVAIILETLGTGAEAPAPPNDALKALYQWWENDHGFNHKWIRTDYQFESVKEADKLTRFFFGDELASRIVNEQLTILPECTGIWWKRF